VDLWVNGNHLEQIVWGPRGKMHLQRIPWRFVVPELSGSGDYILSWTVQKPGEEAYSLTNHEVIHFSLGSTTSGIGLSPLEQLGTTVTFDRAAQSYQLHTMRNQARPGVMVSIDPTVYKDVEIRESVREEFTARHAGIRNAGRPFVATGVDLKEVPQQTVVDADLVKQRLVGREEISAVLGIPTLFLGDASKATMNNVDQYHRQLYKTTLAPALDNITETFYAQVILEHPRCVRDESSYVEFDVSAILSGDPLERAQTYRELQAAGALTINETRERENLPQFDADWANEPMLPTNNLQPASRAFEDDPDTSPETPPDEPDEDEEKPS
jgi:HK97 family phage portal protein